MAFGLDSQSRTTGRSLIKRGREKKSTDKSRFSKLSQGHVGEVSASSAKTKYQVNTLRLGSKI